MIEVRVDELSGVESPHRLDALLALTRAEETPPPPAPEATRRAYERARSLAGTRASAEAFRRSTGRR